MSIMSKAKVLMVSALSIGAIAGTAAFATGASAATTNVPKPLPAACRTMTFNSDKLTLIDSGSPFNYQMRLHLTPVGPWWTGVSVVSGTLCDTYEPVTLVLPVHGIVFGRNVVISVQYPSVGPDAGTQGVRTFSGVIGPFGHVIGSWTETGTEAGAGTFTLARI